MNLLPVPVGLVGLHVARVQRGAPAALADLGLDISLGHGAGGLLLLLAALLGAAGCGGGLVAVLLLLPGALRPGGLGVRVSF